MTSEPVEIHFRYVRVLGKRGRAERGWLNGKQPPFSGFVTVYEQEAFRIVRHLLKDRLTEGSYLIYDFYRGQASEADVRRELQVALTALANNAASSTERNRAVDCRIETRLDGTIGPPLKAHLVARPKNRLAKHGELWHDRDVSEHPLSRSSETGHGLRKAPSVLLAPTRAVSVDKIEMRIRAIEELAESFVAAPRQVPPELKRLEQLLQGLRDEDITDKTAFVKACNRLLVNSACRLQVLDGRLATLKVNKPRPNAEYIQYALCDGRGSVGRLGKTAMRVVPVPPDFGTSKTR